MGNRTEESIREEKMLRFYDTQEETTMVKWLLIGYLLVNVIVFAMYGIDKYKATHKKWRIPEATLIGAAVFGVLGALAGMYIFHHKTKKPKFYITVPAILVLEVAAAICLYLFIL